MESLFLVMPAYNEEETICDVVQSWYPFVADKGKNSRFVVADFGSTDKTHDLLINLKKDFSKLEILDCHVKQHGPKLLALYKYAAKQNASYVFQTDSDGQTNPQEFEKFWALRNQYDVVLGARKKREDGKMRILVEKFVCALLHIYFGVSVPDANAPFRLMKTSVLSKYLDKFPSDYIIPNIILSAFFVAKQEKYKFVDISFKQRQGGTNSINIVRIAKIGFKSLKDFWHFKKVLHAND